MPERALDDGLALRGGFFLIRDGPSAQVIFIDNYATLPAGATPEADSTDNSPRRASRAWDSLALRAPEPARGILVA